jgi:hypothetical protein
MKKPILILTLLILGALLAAQATPPRQKANLAIDDARISIDYGSPSLKGRSMEELLEMLPPDRMWRAGDNQVTTFRSDRDFTIGDVKVPGGTYSVYIHCPDVENASLILNGVVGQPLKSIYAQAPPHLADEPWPHFNYAEEIGEHEAARISLKTSRTESLQDSFKIAFQESESGVELVLAWGNVRWTAPVRVSE